MSVACHTLHAPAGDRGRDCAVVGDVFHLAAMRSPARVALICGDRTWTYLQAVAEIDRIAAALVAMSVNPGDRVLGWLVNRPELCFLAIAAARIGAVLVPMNTRYRAEDAAFVIRHADARLIVLEDRAGPVDFLALLRAIEPSVGTAQEPTAGFPVVVRLSDIPVANTMRWRDFLQAGVAIAPAQIAHRAANVDPDRPFLMPYTSGTTGSPKAVMHSHGALRSVAARADRLGIVASDVIAGYLPLFHLYGFSEAFLMSGLRGACHVLFENFDAPVVLDAVERHGITILHGFDTHYRDLLESQRLRPRETGSLRLATFPTGSDEAAAVAERVEERFCPTVSGFGMTELWAFPCISPPDASVEQRTRASGLPLPGMELRCVDPESGAACRPDAPGEIQMRGYSLMLGYFRDEAATRASFAADGWFRTGDMGLLRSDGHLRFLGRYKDMLKIGGENVAPAEVEAFLMTHPAVREVAVVGRPDARLGEVAVAFVRRCQGSEVQDDELIGFCRGRIASFKIPREVRFVDELPMTPTGKVRKNVLRERLAEQSGPAR